MTIAHDDEAGFIPATYPRAVAHMVENLAHNPRHTGPDPTAKARQIQILQDVVALLGLPVELEWLPVPPEGPSDEYRHVPEAVSMAAVQNRVDDATATVLAEVSPVLADRYRLERMRQSDDVPGFFEDGTRGPERQITGA